MRNHEWVQNVREAAQVAMDNLQLCTSALAPNSPDADMATDFYRRFYDGHPPGRIAGERFNGFTYVLAYGDMIKIGHASDVERRVADVQLMSPVKLDLVAVCHGALFEHVLHEGLRASRLHGEWFEKACGPWTGTDCRGCATIRSWNLGPMSRLVAVHRWLQNADVDHAAPLNIPSEEPDSVQPSRLSSRA